MSSTEETLKVTLSTETLANIKIARENYAKGSKEALLALHKAIEENNITLVKVMLDMCFRKIAAPSGPSKDTHSPVYEMALLITHDNFHLLLNSASEKPDMLNFLLEYLNTAFKEKAGSALFEGCFVTAARKGKLRLFEQLLTMPFAEPVLTQPGENTHQTIYEAALHNNANIVDVLLRSPYYLKTLLEQREYVRHLYHGAAPLALNRLLDSDIFNSLSAKDPYLHNIIINKLARWRDQNSSKFLSDIQAPAYKNILQYYEKVTKEPSCATSSSTHMPPFGRQIIKFAPLFDNYYAESVLASARSAVERLDPNYYFLGLSQWQSAVLEPTPAPTPTSALASTLAPSSAITFAYKAESSSSSSTTTTASVPVAPMSSPATAASVTESASTLSPP